jgi:DNA polymerase-3 subunit epsilon
MPSPALLFVDTETTGTCSRYSRIIEIGLIRVEKNRIVDTYSSLIDPEIDLPPFITKITGINDYELTRAPQFAQSYRDFKSLFFNAIFVAHNASFDYSFFSSELSHLEVPFSLPKLCTVRLSRKLYPQHKSHSLDSLITRHNLEVNIRHRALADAHLLWQWWQIAKQEHGPKKFNSAWQKLVS